MTQDILHCLTKSIPQMIFCIVQFALALES